MIVQSGRQYLMRNGGTAEITNEEASHLLFPFYGIMAGVAGEHQWTREGKFNSQGDSRLDLIEMLPTAEEVAQANMRPTQEEMDKVHEKLKPEPESGPFIGLAPFPEGDMVHHPQHYNMGKIEVLEAIEDWKLCPHLAAVVKYCARAGHKAKGREIEDLRKAAFYLQRKIELLKAAREGREPCRPNQMPKVPV